MQLQIKYNHLCGINTANLKEIMDSYIPCKYKSTASSKSNFRSRGFPFLFQPLSSII